MKLRTKFGELPGDIPRWAKIRMLESRQGFELWPWQYIGRNVIRSYRKDFVKKAVRRSRRRQVEEE